MSKGLAKISKKSLQLSGNSSAFNSVVDSLQTVSNLQDDLKSVLSVKTDAYRVTASSAKEWTERAEKAASMKERAVTPEGRQAMDVLSTKASGFAELYTKTAEKEQASLAEINDQLKKLEDVKMQLTAVEKTQALDITLQKMANEANISISATPGLDSKEITRIIHTAQALVELKTNKL